MIKKLILLAVVAVILIVGGVLVGVYLYMDSLVRDGIVYGTTQATGTPTQLSSARLGLFQGTLDLDNLVIGNPQGFVSEQFLTLSEGGVTVSLGSLRSDHVRVPLITFDGVDIHLERKDQRENFRVILEHMQQLSRQSQQAPADQPGKQYTVEKLVIQNTTIHVNGYPMVTRPIQLPPIVLENIGSGTDRGVVLSQLSGIILREVMNQVMANPGELPAALLGSLSGGLEGLSGLGDVGKVQIGQIGESLQNLVSGNAQLTDTLKGLTGEGGAGQVIQDATGQVDRAVGDLQRGLGGLLGGSGSQKEKQD